MNVLYSAALSKSWVEIARIAQRDYNHNPVYWVGHGDLGLRVFEGCVYHDAWQAFSLYPPSPDLSADGECHLARISRLEYYNYLKILDRVDVGGNFSFSERDNLLKRQLSFWSAVIERYSVDCIVFSNAPHLPHDYPLYLCARQKGLPIVMFNNTSMAGWHYITSELGGDPLPANFADTDSRTAEFYSQCIGPYRMQSHVDPWYMKDQRRRQGSIVESLKSTPILSPVFYFLRFLVRYLRSGNFDQSYYDQGKYSSLKFYPELYGKKKPSFLDVSRIKLKTEAMKKRYRGEYDKYAIEYSAEENAEFLYYPLHYQPELTTTPLGSDASDQLYVARKIAQALPAHVKLVIKEHSSQFSSVLYGDQGRFLGYWELLAGMDNVILCRPEVASIGLITRCRAVVTVTGTAGWEAIVNDIPCILLGDSWYRHFPGVIKSDLDDIDHVVSRVFEERASYAIGNDQYEKSALEPFFHNDIHNIASEVNDREEIARALVGAVGHSKKNGLAHP